MGGVTSSPKRSKLADALSNGSDWQRNAMTCGCNASIEECRKLGVPVRFLQRAELDRSGDALPLWEWWNHFHEFRHWPSPIGRIEAWVRIISLPSLFHCHPYFMESKEGAMDESLSSSAVVARAGAFPFRRPPLSKSLAWIWLALLFPTSPLYAQGTGGDPWDNAVQVLQAAFTSTIARGLSLVAIVVGGLMFAFGEGQSKRTLAGIIFGVGMAVGAVNFMAWLFP
jgi:type IV secretion system protein TrbC